MGGSGGKDCGRKELLGPHASPWRPSGSKRLATSNSAQVSLLNISRIFRIPCCKYARENASNTLQRASLLDCRCQVTKTGKRWSSETRE